MTQANMCFRSVTPAIASFCASIAAAPAMRRQAVRLIDTAGEQATRVVPAGILTAGGSVFGTTNPILRIRK